MGREGGSAWVAASSLVLVAGGAFVVGVVVGRRTGTRLDVHEALLDDEARSAVVEELVRAAEGIFDSHVDGDVGRVMLPNLDGRGFKGTSVVTNAMGMREQRYAAPKPEGLVRVVLLGDSFVFGSGVEMEERLGAQLEQLLRDRSGIDAPAVQCLHLGVSSWNILTEGAFLRRQLSLLSPDLVVQVTVQNDVDDSAGVRGHGGRAALVPRHRERADSLLKVSHPRTVLRQPATNHLNDGLDWESISRFSEARSELLRLAEAVEAQGGRYVLLVNWGERLPLVHEHWGRHLRPDQILYLKPEVFDDVDWVLGAGNTHWSPAGHQRMAMLLYGLAVERDLLPALSPMPWDQAAELVRSIHGEALKAAGGLDLFHAKRLAAPRLSPEVRFLELDRATASQVHGGIDAAGRVGAYASVLMPVEGASRLSLRGRFLGRPEILGARVLVFVDEHEVGVIRVDERDGFEEHFPLPTEVRERAHVSVRLVADDYAYMDPRMVECRVLTLERIALES